MLTVRLPKTVVAAAVVCLCAAATGCAPAAGVAIMGSSAGAATGAGIERTMGGRAHKTFVEPLADVETATLAVLDRMELALEEAEDSEDGRIFKARAEKRQIEIDLERLSPVTTRLSVVAKRRNIFSPDDATATEIILQIAKTLENGQKGESGLTGHSTDAAAGR